MAFNISQLILLFNSATIVLTIKADYSHVSIPQKLTNYHIKSNSSWVGPLVSSQIAVKNISWDYSVRLSADKCCPGFIAVTDPVDDLLIKDGCYNINEELLETLYVSFKEYSTVDWNHYYHKKHDKCIAPDGNGIYSCNAGVSYVSTVPKIVKVYAFYPCYNRQGIDMVVNISAGTVGTHENHCKPVPSGVLCSKYYQHYYLPNIFGHTHTITAVNVFGAIISVGLSKCHQHFEEMLCRALFPECRLNQPYITPCQSMCFEIFSACFDTIEEYSVAWKHFSYFGLFGTNMNAAVNFICNKFPVDGDCLTKNVTCGPLKEVQHSIPFYDRPSDFLVDSRVTYECNEDYELEGNSTVVCEYSGEWSTIPICIPLYNKKLIIILGVTFSTFAVITVIVILVGLIFRREIVVILYAKFGLRFTKNTEEDDMKYDAFIAYSQEDIGFVKHQLLRPLEKMTPKFQICIHHRDFEIGAFITTNIINAIKQSRRTIIVLSQSFIDSEWCKFEFEQAHLQLMHDKSYKLLVIALEEPKNLQKIPQLIQSYILTRTYLMRTDKLFWQKLSYQMPDKKAASESDSEMLEEIQEQKPGQ